MNIIIEETKFHNDIQIDINYLNLQRFTYPVIIATRESQVHRILEWSDRTGYSGKFSILGWWELMLRDYFCENGVVVANWQKHDAVFFLDPNRASDKQIYASIIEIARSI